MTKASDRIYNLLPAVYRLRDSEQGQPLRALLSIVSDEVARAEADITGLYENWFIETSDEWVVPYIGDLLAVRGLNTLQTAAFSQRAYVANTLFYRRRKGTAYVLEVLARDVTGWSSRAVEFFELLQTTQYLNHRRLFNTRPDLRSKFLLALPALVEVGVILINLGETAFAISRSMRIAQMVIAPVSRAIWQEAETLDDTQRGAGGFGSTGTGKKG